MTEHEAMRKAGSSRAGPLRAFGDLDVENMSLMSTGACGAFVHGLEDEFFEVGLRRSRGVAVLPALTLLACRRSVKQPSDRFASSLHSTFSSPRSLLVVEASIQLPASSNFRHS